MGTRADFYVGKTEENMQWLGSIAYDGYPHGIDKTILKAKTEADYIKAVKIMLDRQDDASIPERDGWPWPWETSHTSDYAYTFDAGKCWGTSGHEWWPATKEKEENESEKVYFPNMKRFQKVSFGKRSGLLVIGMKEQ